SAAAAWPAPPWRPSCAARAWPTRPRRRCWPRSTRTTRRRRRRCWSARGCGACAVSTRRSRPGAGSRCWLARATGRGWPTPSCDASSGQRRSWTTPMHNGRVTTDAAPALEREILTYDLFGTAVRDLAQQVVDDGFEPDIVLAIARGGLGLAMGLGY